MPTDAVATGLPTGCVETRAGAERKTLPVGEPTARSRTRYSVSGSRSEIVTEPDEAEVFEPIETDLP